MAESPGLASGGRYVEWIFGQAALQGQASKASQKLDCPLMGILDTLEFLLGNWRVDRRIQDHVLESDGHFQGTASISAWESLSDYDTLVRATMSEAGELRFGAYNGTATRRLELSRLERFAVVSVTFSDGRPFVDLDLRRGTWQSGHVCGNDNYQIITTVLSDDSFEERWQVTGAAKRYDTVTNFVRY